MILNITLVMLSTSKEEFSLQTNIIVDEVNDEMVEGS